MRWHLFYSLLESSLYMSSDHLRLVYHDEHDSTIMFIDSKLIILVDKCGNQLRFLSFFVLTQSYIF